MRPRIDVLLPVLRARRTLPSALGDALGQLGVDVRVLAIVDRPADGDDGSADWLAERARQEPRLTVLDGPGRGAGAALTEGLARSGAGLVAHMEADDRSAPDRLIRLHEALEADRSLAGAVCRAGQFGARTPGMRRYLDWQNGLLTHEQMARERFVEIPALHQTGLYRREALGQAGGYDPRGPWPADIDFWLRWFEHELRVAKLPRVLYRWRQHAGQSTRGGTSHALATLRAAKARYLARELRRRERPVLLLSTGATLQAWREALAAEGIEPVACRHWRPGEPPPLPAGAPPLVLAAYGRPGVRARLSAALAGLREPPELLFTA
jgi:hypothetical protein